MDISKTCTEPCAACDGCIEAHDEVYHRRIRDLEAQLAARDEDLTTLAKMAIEDAETLEGMVAARDAALGEAREALRVYAGRIEDQARMNSMCCDGLCIDAPCHHGLCRSAVRAMCEEMRAFADAWHDPSYLRDKGAADVLPYLSAALAAHPKKGESDGE